MGSFRRELRVTRRLAAVLVTVTASLIAAVGCGGAATPALGPASASPAGPQTFTEATKFEVNVGSPPAAGWRWVLGEFKVGAEPLTFATNKHEDPWLFYVVAGSAEIVTAGKKDVLAPGSALWLPAQLDHSHLFAPQTRALAFQLKAPENAHRSEVLVSGKPLGLGAGTSHTLRVREFTLAPGGSLPERVIAEAGAAYVVEGALRGRSGGVENTIAAGKAFELLSNETHGAVNGSAGPARFVILDVRP